MCERNRTGNETYRAVCRVAIVSLVVLYFVESSRGRHSRLARFHGTVEACPAGKYKP